jgi:acyl-coenzyme A synthetase/AMP-(fatty) acid ligase
VRRVLINHPAVADCAVSRKGPEGAERLEALLVPADRLPEAAFLASVRAYVAEQLTPPERPATLHRCRSLPRTADWKLSAETG